MVVVTDNESKRGRFRLWASFQPTCRLGLHLEWVFDLDPIERLAMGQVFAEDAAAAGCRCAANDERIPK
jgi:hypothetical protein